MKNKIKENVPSLWHRRCVYKLTHITVTNWCFQDRKETRSFIPKLRNSKRTPKRAPKEEKQKGKAERRKTELPGKRLIPFVFFFVPQNEKVITEFSEIFSSIFYPNTPSIHPTYSYHTASIQPYKLPRTRKSFSFFLPSSLLSLLAHLAAHFSFIQWSDLGLMSVMDKSTTKIIFFFPFLPLASNLLEEGTNWFFLFQMEKSTFKLEKLKSLKLELIYSIGDYSNLLDL